MGNNLIDENANYVFQCEPFTHIYFYPKIFEEKPDKSDKISNFSSIRENNTLNSESKTLLLIIAAVITMEFSEGR